MDRKVIMTDENRKNRALKGGAWSDKVHHGGVTFLQFCLPNGLIFEHSPTVLEEPLRTYVSDIWA